MGNASAFTRTAMIVLLVLAVSGAVVAQETLVFWHSGIGFSVIDTLWEIFFEEFEREHNVIIEELPIGWGDERNEKLLLAQATGIGPDVIVSPRFDKFGVPLDRYFDNWDERDRFVPGFVDAMRDPEGVLRAIPHEAEVRGFGYNKFLASESGLDAEAPPLSWDELLLWAKTMTRIEDDVVVVSGFETSWGPPYVGSEFDWFLIQAGGSVASEDLRQATLDTPEGLLALEMFKDMYEAGHPTHAASDRSGGELATGHVAIARANSYIMTEWMANYGTPEGFGLFAPRMAPDTAPVALTFVNGFAITDHAKDPDLAWKFIEGLLSFEVRDEFAKVMAGVSSRIDVGTQPGVPHIEPFMPWYELTQYATPPGFFEGRSGAAPYISEAIQGLRIPKQALELADHAQQVALDRYWD